MPLTYNRYSYTASQLNAFFEEARDQIAAVLPPDARDYNGSLFDNLQIDETDAIASEIEDLDDILKAIGYLGTLDRPLRIEIRRDPDDGSLIYANQYNSGPEHPDKSYAEYDADGLQILTKYERMPQYEIPEINREIWSDGAGQLIPLQRPYEINWLSQVRFKNTVTLDAVPNVARFKDGWYGQGFKGQEAFSGTGYDDWGLDISTNTVGTTYTIMNLDGEGINKWGNNTVYEFTEEQKWRGFPEGTSPPSGDGGDCTQVTEDLSSQVNGSTTAFETSVAFVTDCLHVYWNGQRLRSGSEYNVNNNNKFTTTFTPSDGTSIVVDLVRIK